MHQVTTAETPAPAVRGFWRLARGFWARGGPPLSRMFSVALLLMVVLGLAASYGMNVWNRAIFDALEKPGRPARCCRCRSSICRCWRRACWSASCRSTLRMTMQRRWRAWLTQHLLDRWLRQRPLLPAQSRQRRPQEPRISHRRRRADRDRVAGRFRHRRHTAVLSAATFIVVLWTIGGVAHRCSIAGIEHHHPGLPGGRGGDLCGAGERAWCSSAGASSPCPRTRTSPRRSSATCSPGCARTAKSIARARRRGARSATASTSRLREVLRAGATSASRACGPRSSRRPAATSRRSCRSSCARRNSSTASMSLGRGDAGGVGLHHRAGRLQLAGRQLSRLAEWTASARRVAALMVVARQPGRAPRAAMAVGRIETRRSTAAAPRCGCATSRSRSKTAPRCVDGRRHRDHAGRDGCWSPAQSGTGKSTLVRAHRRACGRGAGQDRGPSRREDDWCCRSGPICRSARLRRAATYPDADDEHSVEGDRRSLASRSVSGISSTSRRGSALGPDPVRRREAASGVRAHLPHSPGHHRARRGHRGARSGEPGQADGAPDARARRTRPFSASAIVRSSRRSTIASSRSCPARRVRRSRAISVIARSPAAPGVRGRRRVAPAIPACCRRMDCRGGATRSSQPRCRDKALLRARGRAGKGASGEGLPQSPDFGAQRRMIVLSLGSRTVSAASCADTHLTWRSPLSGQRLLCRSTRSA